MHDLICISRAENEWTVDDQHRAGTNPYWYSRGKRAYNKYLGKVSEVL